MRNSNTPGKYTFLLFLWVALVALCMPRLANASAGRWSLTASYPSEQMNQGAGGSPQPLSQQTMGLGQMPLPTRFGYGVTVQLLGQPAAALLNGVAGMHFQWVRQPIRWQDIEPFPGQSDWTELDAVIDELDVRGIATLLVIEGTPGWARSPGAEPGSDGPPADPQAFATFVGQLVSRYADQVEAYQIWQDPNLPAHWDSPEGDGAERYVQLLQVAYQVIKKENPGAVVISAGVAPAPADELGGQDDLIFLQQMLSAGLTNWCDAVGVHLDGSVNPPADYVEQTMGVATSERARSGSFFRHYEAIHLMLQGHDEKPLWLTQVGWAVSDDSLGDSPVVAGVSEEEQALFLVQAFELAAREPYVHVMIVDNFNLAAVDPDDPAASYSLIRPDWQARPAFVQLAQMRQQQILANSGIVMEQLVNRAPQSGVKPH